MKEFLSKLKQEGTLQSVAPSEEICKSYLQKADECLKSAKLLFENKLYETSVSMSYYAMYDALTALLFGVGIKCENHAGAIQLLDALFKNHNLYKDLSFAKEARIDNQYYIHTVGNLQSEIESTKILLLKAESAIIKLRLMIRDLNEEELKRIRNEFVAL